MNVLVINAGSSSLKYQLLNPETGALLAKGLCERIGIDGKFTYKPQIEGKAMLDAVDVAMPTHSEAIQAVLNALVDPENGVIASMDEIDAVGHRVVHGGESFASSVLITDEVMAAHRRSAYPLAPLHNPANITGINACQAVLGEDVPQVAVFDTAFHQTMPAKAYTYAIPYEYYENDKMRRYGFHGTSHQLCVPALRPRCWARTLRGAEARLLPSGQRFLSRCCGRRQERRHLHGPDSSGRSAHGHPFRRHGCRRHRVSSTNKYSMNVSETRQYAEQEVRRAGHLRCLLRLP